MRSRLSQPPLRRQRPPAAQPPAPEAPRPPAQEAAAACPGNPDALGTSRVLTIQPGEFQLLGTINYKQTLPLKDHEVVLTFDDGPIPPYTTSVLDTLAANCVKATYFLVGEMAGPRPYLVRRIYNEGHRIGTHQPTSPLRLPAPVDGSGSSAKSTAASPRSMARSAIRRPCRRSSAFPASAAPMRSTTIWSTRG